MIAIIDYGMGNLRSVFKAVQIERGDSQVTSDKKDIERASALILPGVGAFSHAVKNLKDLGIYPVIRKEIERGKPFLGICLGLQLLFTESEEEGLHKGFDIIKGRVKRFQVPMKIPHMGWNQIKFRMPAPTRRRRGEQNPLRQDSGQAECKILEGVPDDSYFYFVHSYYVEPEDKGIVVTTTDYGIEFVSMIQKENIYGVQFHPEKSQERGLRLLRNFIKQAGHVS